MAFGIDLVCIGNVARLLESRQRKVVHGSAEEDLGGRCAAAECVAMETEPCKKTRPKDQPSLQRA